MDELKSCPFCGGEAHIMDMGYPHWIYCLNCGAKVHGRVVGDEKASIDAWNRRVNETKIVNCDECIYAKIESHANAMVWCTLLKAYRYDLDFCSDGERKYDTIS